jgi:hypothetical protein
MTVKITDTKSAQLPAEVQRLINSAEIWQTG